MKFLVLDEIRRGTAQENFEIEFKKRTSLETNNIKFWKMDRKIEILL
jgi:hypothetical protein